MHDRDLLLLRDDDLLGKPPQASILAVAYLYHRHVDGSLVMGDHHAREIAVSIAGVRDVHVLVHARDGIVHHRAKALSRVGAPIAGTRSGSGGTSDNEREHQKSGKEAGPQFTSLHVWSANLGH